MIRDHAKTKSSPIHQGCQIELQYQSRRDRDLALSIIARYLHEQPITCPTWLAIDFPLQSRSHRAYGSLRHPGVSWMGANIIGGLYPLVKQSLGTFDMSPSAAHLTPEGLDADLDVAGQSGIGSMESSLKQGRARPSGNNVSPSSNNRQQYRSAGVRGASTLHIR